VASFHATLWKNVQNLNIHIYFSINHIVWLIYSEGDPVTITIIHLPRKNENGINTFAALRHVFTHGGCGMFALALHRITGWPVVTLDTCKDTYLHLGVQSPTGTLWDARGEHPTIASFVSKFTNIVPEALRIVSREEIMTSFHAHLRNLDNTERLASEMYPELPHQPSSDRQRTIAFVEDVDALSRQHRLWIEPISRNAVYLWPVIGNEFDGIVGYRTENKRGNITFNRMLASEKQCATTAISRRVERFLRELEILSRKHRLWIRAGFPTKCPLLITTNESEIPSKESYVIRQSDNFAGFFLGINT
jgi:hypothetical protein